MLQLCYCSLVLQNKQHWVILEVKQNIAEFQSICSHIYLLEDFLRELKTKPQNLQPYTQSKVKTILLTQIIQ